MAKKILGDSIDIHGGGLDLMFPHHENELAQSESCTGKPFARYWMHNGLMQASGSAGKVGGGHDKQGDKPADLTAAKEAQEANKLAGSKGAASVKELFAKHNVPTTPGRVTDTADGAKAIAEEIGHPVMVKAQVKVGGRGKAGGVKYAATPEDACRLARDRVAVEAGQRLCAEPADEVDALENNLNLKP